MSERDLELEAIRTHSYASGYKEGYRDALDIQHNFSRAFADELVKAKLKIRQLCNEVYEYRSKLSNLNKKVSDGTS